MTLLYISKITDTKAIINGMHFMPELLTESDKAQGILVESVPAIEPISGKIGMQYINPQTLEITCEYIEDKNFGVTPLEQKVEQLETDNANISYALMMGGLI